MELYFLKMLKEIFINIMFFECDDCIVDRYENVFIFKKYVVKYFLLRWIFKWFSKNINFLNGGKLKKIIKRMRR